MRQRGGFAIGDGSPGPGIPWLDRHLPHLPHDLPVRSLTGKKRPGFVRDLDVTRMTIAEKIAQTRPDRAVELMWRFMALAESVMNRVDGSSGTVGGVFRAACEDLGVLAAKTRPDPNALAAQVFAAVMKNDYGEFDNPIPVILVPDEDQKRPSVAAGIGRRLLVAGRAAEAVRLDALDATGHADIRFMEIVDGGRRPIFIV